MRAGTPAEANTHLAQFLSGVLAAKDTDPLATLYLRFTGLAKVGVVGVVDEPHLYGGMCTVVVWREGAHVLDEPRQPHLPSDLLTLFLVALGRAYGRGSLEMGVIGGVGRHRGACVYATENVYGCMRVRVTVCVCVCVPHLHPCDSAQVPVDGMTSVPPVPTGQAALDALKWAAATMPCTQSSTAWEGKLVYVCECGLGVCCGGQKLCSVAAGGGDTFLL